MSSAEAELHALCKCASESLAVVNMAHECYAYPALRLHTDSSAARGIVQRAGCGKVKHLDIKSLWVQERERVGDFKTCKVPRAVNWSDLMTHHWHEVEGINHMNGLNAQRRARLPEPAARGCQEA